MTTKALLAPVFAAAALVALPMSAAAQQVASAPVAAPVPASTTINAFPSIFGAASAFPGSPNSGFVALTYANPNSGIAGRGADGSLSLGYTVGSPIDNVAVTAGVNVTSITTDPGDSGNLFLSVARSISVTETGATFVGASAGSLAGWGDAENTPESFSVYVSHLTAFDAGATEIPVQFTLGYGNRTTLSTDGLGTVDDGFFAGVGVGVAENLSVSLSMSESTVNIGATATIPGVDGLSITAGMYDVADNADRQQFALTVGFGF